MASCNWVKITCLDAGIKDAELPHPVRQTIKVGSKTTNTMHKNACVNRKLRRTFINESWYDL